VNNAIDSIAVIGTDAASRLSAAQPGRCIVARDGTLLTAQIAQTSQADIDRMMGRNGAVNSDSPTAADACVVRRPWLDPLPALVPLPNTADPAGPVAPQEIVLGLEDVPEEQRQSFVSVRRQQLQLLAIGVHGSGKSVFVRTIADQWSGELRSADGSVEALWDALEWAENWCQDRTGPNECDSALLILDDLDALVGRMQQEYQDTAMDRLVHVLRNGPNADLAVVATAVTATAVLRRAVNLFGDTLLLRQPSRQEHVLAGASAALFDEQAHPGCGVWRGHKIQVAVSAAHVADRNHQPSPVTSVESLREGATILVTGSPAARIRSLRARTIQADVIDIADVAAGALPADIADGGLQISSVTQLPRPSILVGDPDAWQARWSLFGSLRRHCRIVFDGCELAQVRALLQTRVLPPLLGAADQVWVREPAGAITRARLNLQNEQ
jgi:S-DNA-T family DNA segregation ATPase FtsK/SpoIIIE